MQKQNIPRFKVKGKLESSCIQITKPLKGEVSIGDNKCQNSHLSLGLLEKGSSLPLPFNSVVSEIVFLYMDLGFYS